MRQLSEQNKEAPGHSASLMTQCTPPHTALKARCGSTHVCASAPTISQEPEAGESPRSLWTSQPEVYSTAVKDGHFCPNEMNSKTYPRHSPLTVTWSCGLCVSVCTLTNNILKIYFIITFEWLCVPLGSKVSDVPGDGVTGGYELSHCPTWVLGPQTWVLCKSHTCA